MTCIGLVKEVESAGSDFMTKNQFFSMIKCENCLRDIKEEFLFSNPGLENIFSDLSMLSEQILNELKSHASYVLEMSDHLVMIYSSENEHIPPYMTIYGFTGIYKAFNDDFSIFFDTEAEAVKYVDVSYLQFKRDLSNLGIENIFDV